MGSTKAGIAVADSGAGNDAANVFQDVKIELSLKKSWWDAYTHDKFDEGTTGKTRAYRFIALSTLLALPAAVFIVAFTSMGYGESTFSGTKQNEHLAGAFQGIFWLAFFVTYFSDGFTNWGGRPLLRCPRYTLLGTMALCFTLGTIFSAGDYPYGPMCLLTIGLPAWIVISKRFSSKKLDELPMEMFLSFLPAPMALDALLALLVWIIWILVSGHTWNGELKTKYAKEVGCNDKNDCFEALLIWIGPLIVTLVYAFFAVVIWLLESPSRQEGMAVKAFGSSTLLVLFAMWIATSLAGVSEGTAGAIFMFAVSAFIASVMLVVSTFGTENMQAEASHWADEFLRNNKGICDWLKGMFVVTSTPFFMFYTGLSFVNQRVRIYSCCTTLTIPPEHNAIETKAQSKRHSFTKRTQKQIQAIKRWDRTNVLLCAIILGIAFMCLNVLMAKFTVLFLAWIIAVCKTLPLYAVIGILVGVGITLFLLPPVPGAPIYVTAGIVIPAVAKDQLGISLCIIFALVLSLFNKLFAHTLQQCVIGTFLGGKLYVRQTCQVNSLMIKAFQLILAKPGLSIAKVSILIGGPDWPTSVLCGILKVPYIQTLIGTAPAIMLITPCVLTGSFYYLSGEEPEENWDTAAAIMATIAAMVQCGSLVVASYFVEKTIRENTEKIAKIPDDEEVKAADLAAAARRLVWTTVTKWPVLPKWTKYVVAGNLIIMLLQCYMVQFFPASCFRNFQLTDKIKDLPGGNAANMTRPAGYLVLVLFGLSCILLQIFYNWSSGAVTRAMAQTPVSVQAVTRPPVTAIEMKKTSSPRKKSAPISRKAASASPSQNTEKISKIPDS
jgi:hypothetical protein